jgi:hypothetical protein
MDSNCERIFAWLLRDLSVFLKPYGFRRSGQRFSRQNAECWQVIAVQKSRYSGSGEKNLTVNFGVTSKRALTFHGLDASRVPLDWTCPIRCRISHFMEKSDIWWTLKDEEDGEKARAAITDSLGSAGIPFLDSLNSDEEILAFYTSGGTMGFEIDRDELRLVLLASLAKRDEAQQRLTEYESRWLASGAATRASAFVQKYRQQFSS